MFYIDMQPKEAAISLLRSIAYHERQARKAEARDREESLRYHEASRKDAEELLALYEKRWPEEAGIVRLEYEEAEATEAGNYPETGHSGSVAEVRPTVRTRRYRSLHQSRLAAEAAFGLRQR